MEDYTESYKSASLVVGPLKNLDKKIGSAWAAGLMAKAEGGLTVGQWIKMGLRPAPFLPTRAQTGALVARTTIANTIRIGFAWETGNAIGTLFRIGTNRVARAIVDD